MLDLLLHYLTDAFDRAQQALFESLVQPLAFALGLGNVVEDAFGATGWLLVGLLQLLVMLLVFRALERWWPVEPVTDRAAVRVDVIYTLIHRLGLFRLVLFLSIEPLWDSVLFGSSQLRLAGMSRPGSSTNGWRRGGAA